MTDKPIDLYSWPTPNGHKVHIALEEMALPYVAHGVDIGAGAQFDPAFLKISPNNKVPAMVDPDGPGGKPMVLFESGAMLMYLAGKTQQFLPASGAARYAVLQWLMFQMGSIGPMLGQAHHFRSYAPEKITYAIDRYTNEAKRLYGVMDKRLGEARFLAGEDYTIADMATWPWIKYWERHGVDLNALPNVKRWFQEIAERPAVQRGIKVLEQYTSTQPFSAEQKRILFGDEQYKRR
ncbi:MAG: glutathione binding-like protein [Dongiaceae bacterium]